MAVLPSRRISAPRRRISSMCMKRFSKMVSMMVPTPSATVLSAANCACMSVGNAGYGAVRTSTDLRPRARACPPRSSCRRCRPWRRPPRSLASHRIQMIRAGVLDAHVAAGDRAGDQVGAALDAIRQHLVAGAAQVLDALDDDLVGAGAVDLGAHGDQEIGQIHHLRLARGVLDDGLPVGERRGHHQVLGAGHRDGIEHQARARAGARRARGCSRPRW